MCLSLHLADIGIVIDDFFHFLPKFTTRHDRRLVREDIISDIGGCDVRLWGDDWVNVVKIFLFPQALQNNFNSLLDLHLFGTTCAKLRFEKPGEGDQ